MIDEKRFLDALLMHHQAHAVESTMRGVDDGQDPAYILGLRTGFSRGLKKSEELLLRLIEDEKEKDL